MHSFKMRRVKRVVRRFSLFFLGTVGIVSAIFVIYQNYHYRLYHRAYNYFIRSTSLMDFNVKNIHIYGNHHVSQKTILNVLPIRKGTPLFTYDTDLLKQYVQSVVRLKYVSVRKRYPQDIDIFVEERCPIAQCVYKNEYGLIDDQGVMYQVVKVASKDLPIIEGGREVSVLFPAFFKEVSNYPGVQKNVHIYQLVKNRRWNLIMKDGSKVVLPQHNVARALKVYQNMKNKNYHIIDLRVSKYIYLKRGAS